MEPEPTVEVVADACNDQDHQERHKGPVDEERQERQLEHVEADRLVELRICHPKGLATAEQQPMLPLVARRGPDDESQDEGHDGAQGNRVPADDLLVAANDLELRRDQQCSRGNAVDHPEADPAGNEEHAYEHAGKLELGLDQQAPHCRKVDRAVPEVVRVEVGQSLDHDQGHDHKDHGPDDPDLGPPTRVHPGR